MAAVTGRFVQELEALKVSVIIPVYNVEDYIGKCLESLVNQTYKNIEIIIVDDGSTDGTAAMCDAYAMKDLRIRVFHKENQGQAAARNFAFSYVSGDFVMYVDGDDYVSEHMVEALVQTAERYGADFVQCYAQKFWQTGKYEHIQIDHNQVLLMTASEALRYYCYQRKIYASPWPKIIKTEILKNIRFPEDTGYEDAAVIFRILGRSSQIAVYPEVMYFYLQRKNSTMRMKFSEKKLDRVRVAGELKKYIQEHYPENTKAVNTRYLLANLQLLMELPFSGDYKKIRHKTFGNIKEIRKNVIRDKDSKISIRLMALASYAGAVPLMCLGRIYNKLVNH